MELKIYGTGCAKCNKLEDLVKEVVQELGDDANVSKVSEVKEIAKAGILMTPGLTVNGQQKVAGKIPSKAEMTKIITNELAKE